METLDYGMKLLEIIEDRSVFIGRKSACSSEKELHIGYGIDNNYVRCMGASIASICSNNRHDNFVFHILASGLKQDNIEKLKQLANDFNIDIYLYHINNEIFKKLPTQAHLPLPTYYRFILPLLLDIPKILYIDADIICLGNIRYLFEADMGDKIILAVPDSEFLSTKRNEVLGLKNHIYFNAGVLLIDIRKWNDIQVMNLVIEVLIKDPKKFRYLDQDALNLILTGKVKYLGREWNYINTPEMKEDTIKLLHFAAHPKPWTIAWGKSDLCNDFTRNIYSDYENLTPWKNSELVGPQNYKEMKTYSHCLIKAGLYKEGVFWYSKYLAAKMKFKIGCR